MNEFRALVARRDGDEITISTEALSLADLPPGDVTIRVLGGFQWSSQHLDDGGVWWRQDRVARRGTSRVFGDGNGARIGRCAHRSAPRGVLSPRVRFSVRSGG